MKESKGFSLGGWGFRSILGCDTPLSPACPCSLSPHLGPSHLPTTGSGRRPVRRLHNRLNVIPFTVLPLWIISQGLACWTYKSRLISNSAIYSSFTVQKIMTHTFMGLSIFDGLFLIPEPAWTVHSLNCHAACNLGNWLYFFFFLNFRLVWNGQWETGAP